MEKSTRNQNMNQRSKKKTKNICENHKKVQSLVLKSGTL